MVRELKPVIQRQRLHGPANPAALSDDGLGGGFRLQLREPLSKEVTAAPLNQGHHARLLMPMKDSVALPVADGAAPIHVLRAVLNTDSVRNATETGTLGQVALIAPALGMTAVTPQIASAGLVPANQLIDPLVRHQTAATAADEPSNLLRAPALTQTGADPHNDRHGLFVGLASATTALVTALLGLIRAVLPINAVSPDLTRDRAATALELLSNGSKTALVLQAGLNLVSLSLGQLSVSHLLFTLVGKGGEGTGGGPLSSTGSRQSAAVII